MLVAAVALGLAGCGSARDAATPGRHLTTTVQPTFTAPVTTPASTAPQSLRTTTTYAVCGTHRWAFGFTPVEPALGNRYLSIQVRNCTAQPATVPQRPPITIIDKNGKTVVVKWDWRPAQASYRVGPGEDRWLRLHWHSSGRCDRGGSRLEVRIDGRTGRLDDCLQLGGLSDVTGQPAAADATWAAAP